MKKQTSELRKKIWLNSPLPLRLFEELLYKFYGLQNDNASNSKKVATIPRRRNEDNKTGVHKKPDRGGSNKGKKQGKRKASNGLGRVRLQKRGRRVGGTKPGSSRTILKKK